MMSNGKPIVSAARHLLLAAAFATTAAFGVAEAAEPKPVLLISMDGMKPEYVWNADALGLKIPNLRSIAEEGVHAERVRGVLPASTFPSHITLITGVSPGTHGVHHNRPFASEERISGKRWDWLAKHIQVPTLWNVTAETGLRVGVVGWPGSVGATDIHYNIPERVVGSNNEEHWKVVTPGLIDVIGPGAEARIREGSHYASARDWDRTSYALEIIEKKGPDLIAVHLAALDSAQHRDGPFSPYALEILEELDEMIGHLRDGFRAHHPGGIVCVASDHGFSEVTQVLRIDAAFVREGLVTLDQQERTYGASTVADWQALRVPAGGSSPVFLKDPNDPELRERVGAFLQTLAADPENGIAAILDKEEIAELGGNPRADFWIDLRPGFSASHHLVGNLTAPRGPGRDGTHGYSPANEEMDSAFLISGDGIRRGETLGKIDMRSIAPTLAKALGTSMPTAEAEPLDVFAESWNVRDEIPLSDFIIQSHRGMGEVAPENTLETFKRAWQLGTVPETDLRTTRDQVIVAFHDTHFRRVVKEMPAELDGLGVADLDFAALAEIDVGSVWGKSFADERIPAIRDVFEAMSGHPDRRIYLDIKDVDLETLAGKVRAAGIERQVILSTSRHELIREWKALVPESETLLWIGGPQNRIAGRLAAVRKTDFDGITQVQIHIRKNSDADSNEPFTVSRAFLRETGTELRDRGILFQSLPWDAADPETYWALMDLGMASFATDFPEKTVQAIRDYYERDGSRQGN